MIILTPREIRIREFTYDLSRSKDAKYLSWMTLCKYGLKCHIVESSQWINKATYGSPRKYDAESYISIQYEKSLQ